MADTAIKTEEEKREYFDTPEELDAKVERLAMEILASEHFVAFTGAGLSTAAGIPDYRSGVNTVLKTGPGCWETAAAIQAALKAGKDVKQIPKAKFRTSIQRSMPTKGHMALYALMEAGLLKHIISQNVDGLHRKSGVPAAKLTEVHGNTNLEICVKCDKGYMRDYRTRTAQKVHDHLTGRKCDNAACGGALKDTIINFGENLRQSDLNRGFNQGQLADVMLCIGSSLRVNPAAQMVEETSECGGRVWIINLQKTPHTPIATQIYAKIDDVLELLMKKLSMAIPIFTLKRHARFTLSTNATNGKEYLSCAGIDENGGPYTIFDGVTLNGEKMAKIPLKDTEKSADTVYEANLKFQGHYNESDLSIQVPRALF